MVDFPPELCMHTRIRKFNTRDAFGVPSDR
jgi:hypothetical protein